MAVDAQSGFEQHRKPTRRDEFLKTMETLVPWSALPCRFPDVIQAVYPKAVVQLCIVYMVRHSLNSVSWKRRKEVAADLRRIYTAATAERP